MDIGLIMKIAGVGILVAVINQVLSKAGREEHAMFVTLAGVIAVLLVLISEVVKLFESVKSAFGL